MSQYVKKDTELGYIEDNAEIEYARFNNMRHAVLGYMLGDFDTNGNYFVSDEIVRELISIKKYYVDTINEIDICRSAIKLDKQITFFVDIQNDKATLSLAEKLNFGANHKLNSGVYSNINEYVLDELELTGPIDRNAIYSHWNIDSFPGETLDVFHMDPETLAKHFNVVNRYKYLLAANTVLLQKEEKLEEIEAKYSNKIMAILAKYPKLKDAVMQDVKLAMEEKKDFLRIDKPNFAKTLNEVIEDSIQEHLDVLSEKEQAKFKEEKHTAQVEINQERAVEVPVNSNPVVDAEATKTEAIELPSIATIEVPQETPVKDPVDLAKELIEQEKHTEERIQNEAVEIIKPNKDKSQEVEKRHAPEREKLIETLEKETEIKKEDNVSKEIKEKAGIKDTSAQKGQAKEQGNKKGQEVQQEEKKADPTKAPVKKDDAKKDAGKKADAKKDAGKKPTPAKKETGKKPDKPKDRKVEKPKEKGADKKDGKGLVGQLAKGKQTTLGKNSAGYVPPITPSTTQPAQQPAPSSDGKMRVKRDHLVNVTTHERTTSTAKTRSITSELSVRPDEKSQSRESDEKIVIDVTEVSQI